MQMTISDISRPQIRRSVPWSLRLTDRKIAKWVRTRRPTQNSWHGDGKMFSWIIYLFNLFITTTLYNIRWACERQTCLCWWWWSSFKNSIQRGHLQWKVRQHDLAVLVETFLWELILSAKVAYCWKLNSAVDSCAWITRFFACRQRCLLSATSLSRPITPDGENRDFKLK